MINNKKKLIESLLKESSGNLVIESLDKINQLFSQGELTFDHDSKWNIDGKLFTGYRDFSLILNLSTLQKDKKDTITYMNDKFDKLEFEYIYENGSIIPNRVYIVDGSEFYEKIQEMRKKYNK